MQVSELITKLEGYLSKPVILSNQAAPKPPYPYIAVTITSAFIPAPSSSIYNKSMQADIKQLNVSQPTMTMSVTAYSKDFDEANGLAQQTHDWFGFVGYRTLKE
ncbi:phage neck terminator protein, partial [Staphylococcus aureus]|uniref:phage neck terminator protein n=1 Tax=Staphylococcus aureus TaxID=1280 RepID=UPI003D138C47